VDKEKEEQKKEERWKDKGIFCKKGGGRSRVNASFEEDMNWNEKEKGEGVKEQQRKKMMRRNHRSMLGGGRYHWHSKKHSRSFTK